MNHKVRVCIFLTCWVFVVGWAGAENDFHHALNKANGGETAQAIIDLEKLSQENPNDGKILLSLGLLYHSTDQIDNAIPVLEKAMNLQPDAHGYFVLALDYESKFFSTKDNDWKNKSIEAWANCLKVAPPDHPHRFVADKHLKRLENNE